MPLLKLSFYYHYIFDYNFTTCAALMGSYTFIHGQPLSLLKNAGKTFVLSPNTGTPKVSNTSKVRFISNILLTPAHTTLT